MRSAAKQTIKRRIEGRQSRCSEASGVVADRYGSVGLARPANDARVEGDVRAYETFAIYTQLTMLRIKALYHSRGIPTAGTGVYQVKQREHWLKQLTEVGMQQRAAWLYQQLDHVRGLRKQAKAAVVAEGQRHR